MHLFVKIANCVMYIYRYYIMEVITPDQPKTVNGDMSESQESHETILTLRKTKQKNMVLRSIQIQFWDILLDRFSKAILDKEQLQELKKCRKQEDHYSFSIYSGDDMDCQKQCDRITNLAVSDHVLEKFKNKYLVMVMKQFNIKKRKKLSVKIKDTKIKSFEKLQDCMLKLGIYLDVSVFKEGHLAETST